MRVPEPIDRYDALCRDLRTLVEAWREDAARYKDRSDGYSRPDCATKAHPMLGEMFRGASIALSQAADQLATMLRGVNVRDL